MISQTTEYALKAVLCLAHASKESLSVQEIASATKMPMNYLSKVLQQLGKSGIVRSRRGLLGGFCLNASPQEISVLDVIQAVAPFKRFQGCPLGLAHSKLDFCPLSQCLNEVTDLVEKKLHKLTIHDLIRYTDHRK